jgi:hypothetical protein
MVGFLEPPVYEAPQAVVLAGTGILMTAVFFASFSAMLNFVSGLFLTTFF